MRDLIFDALQTSGLGTMLFCLLLCCKRPMLKHCGANFWHTALLVNVAMFIVPVYPMKLALIPLAQPLRLISRYAYGYMAYSGNTIIAAPLQNSMLARTAVTVWMVGAAVFLASKIVVYVCFTIDNKKKSYPAPTIVADIFSEQILQDKSLNKANRLGGVGLFLNDYCTSPYAYGFLRKKIILPGKTIESYDELEISLMLRHEAVHIRKNDSWKRLFIMLAHALNWFNPIFILLSRSLCESMELRCDEEVFSQQGNYEMRVKYGELLLSMASDQRKTALSEQPMSNKGYNAQRVESITAMPRKSKKSLIGLFSILLLTASLIYLTGFTIYDRRMEPGYKERLTDYGVEVSHFETPPPSDKTLAHDLYKKGEYFFDGYLLADTVNYVPTSFVTNSAAIALTLQSKAQPVTVYIYYSDDLDYPLMQLVLDKKGTRKTFTALSGHYTYSLGFIVDSSSEDKVQVSIE